MKCPKCQAVLADDARFCSECGEKLTIVAAESVAQMSSKLGGLRTEDNGTYSEPSNTAEQRLMQPGEVFAQRFEIVSLIGVGGMGVVYRARDKVTSKDVALKLIRADRLAGKSSADAVQRLIREGITSRDIRHENVVAVYDVNETNGQPYMSMEFLAGESLRSWNQKRLNANTDCSMRTAAAIVGEILAGLDAAHRAGVIHRDLKPDNVMLLSTPNDNGVRLKILDFGVARAPGTQATGSTTLGTIGYMAPEQLTAPDSAQASADLYSLSVMFYELLVGVLPLGHWQPPSNGRSDVPQAIDALIEKGMSNNPRGRQQTVADYLKAMIEAMQAGTNAITIDPRNLPDWLKRLQDNKDLKWILDVFGPVKPVVHVKDPTTDVTPRVSGNVTLWSGFMHAITAGYANGKGRAGLKEYWGFSVFGAVLFGLGIMLDGVNATSMTAGYPSGVGTFGALIILIPPAIAVTARRLHDLGKKATLGNSMFNAALTQKRGTVGANEYGPDPLGPDAGGAA